MKKLGILGTSGKMGQRLCALLTSPDKPWAAELSACHYRKQKPENLPPEVLLFDAAEDIFKTCDAVIDFTSPHATLHHAALAAQYQKPLLIGTTGLSEGDEADLRQYSNNTAIILAPNTAFCVNYLCSLVKQTAKALPHFDIEICESHHNAKKDAPSGTALALGHAAAKGRNKKLEDIADYARSRETGARVNGHIGFSVIRGGDVVGEHTVYFLGTGERLELTHKATNRDIFAKGAIEAALWLAGCKAGFYTMEDYINN